PQWQLARCTGWIGTPPMTLYMATPAGQVAATLAPRQWQAAGFLHGAQHEAGVHVGHPGVVEQAVEQEAREVLQVLDVDVQQVVHVAGQGMAGHHLLPVLHMGDEAVDAGRAVLLQLHPDEGLQAQAQRARVQARAVAGDHPGGLQPLDPAQAGRGAEVHPRRQFGIGGAAFLLQQGQQAQVGAVEFDGGGHSLHCTTVVTQQHCARRRDIRNFATRLRGIGPRLGDAPPVPETPPWPRPAASNPNACRPTRVMSRSTPPRSSNSHGTITAPTTTPPGARCTSASASCWWDGPATSSCRPRTPWAWTRARSRASTSSTRCWARPPAGPWSVWKACCRSWTSSSTWPTAASR